MGRTVPSISQIFHSEKALFRRFRGGLARQDQLILDQLFVYANLHLAEAAYAAHPVPMEVFILAMLLEQQKVVVRLRQRIDELKG